MKVIPAAHWRPIAFYWRGFLITARPDGESQRVWVNDAVTNAPLAEAVFGPQEVSFTASLERAMQINELLAKAKLAKERLRGVKAADDESLEKKFPALALFLTALDDGTGRERTPSKVTLFAEQGTFKAFLNDVENNQSLCVSASSFDGLWKALEKAVTAEEPGWRANRFGGTPKKKK